MGRTEEYWERRRLDEERSAARKRGAPRTEAGEKPEFTFAAAKRAKVTGEPCRVCALQRRRNTYSIEGHHITHRSRIGGRHRLVHHPDNVLPVCHTHHQHHHTTTNRIPWAALTPEEQAFVVEYGGPSWAERWYPRGEDDGEAHDTDTRAAD